MEKKENIIITFPYYISTKHVFFNAGIGLIVKKLKLLLVVIMMLLMTTTMMIKVGDTLTSFMF
jgi:hypothetical protein